MSTPSGTPFTLDPSTRRGTSCLQRHVCGPAGVAVERRASRWRRRSYFSRHKSQRPRRRQHQSRTFQQLAAKFGRGCSRRLAYLDGHGPSDCDDCHRGVADCACGIPSLPSIPLLAPLGSAIARVTFAASQAEPLLLTNAYFIHCPSQSKNVLYQNCAFCGFKIQCPSSGNTISFDGTPCLCSVLKNSSDCVYGTR